MGTFQTTRGTPLLDNGKNQGIVWLHTASRLTFDYIERAAGATDKRNAVPDEPAKLIISDLVRTPGKLTLTVSARVPGVYVVDGINAAGAISGGMVVIADNFKNHPRMEVDLLADVCRGSDAAKIVMVQRLLYSQKQNIFDQKNDANIAAHGKMGCGKVVKSSAESLFGAINPIAYENPYHEPLKAVRDRDDVKYRGSIITKVRTAIRSFLKKGTPVRVGVLDAPIGMHVVDGKLYAYYAGGHTCLIVGCSSDTKNFLYIDPWPGGSVMKYEGGLAVHPLADPCEYLGMFEVQYDEGRAVEMGTTEPNLILQSTAQAGSFKFAKGNFLEIVSGPRVLP